MNDSWVPEAEAKEQYLNDGFWPFSVPDLWYLSGSPKQTPVTGT